MDPNGTVEHRAPGGSAIEQHLNILGALYLALAALNVLAAVLAFTVIAGGGLISGEPRAITITSTVATVVALFLLVTAVPGLIGGLGVLRRASWSRTLLFVLGILNLIHIPFGTALGVYTLWVLTRPEAAAALHGNR